VPTIFDGLVDQWTTAVKAKDSAALVSLVTEDCIFLAPNAPPLRGRVTVEQLYRTLFARYDLIQAFRLQETQLIGEWAFAWGLDEITMTPIAGGDAVHFVGHGLSILHRGWDGAWRFARGINNATRQA
jgi:uncharacterized protein (TIGR02246 family)